MHRISLTLLGLLSTMAAPLASQTVSVVADTVNPRIRFGVQHLEAALAARGLSLPPTSTVSRGAASSALSIVLATTTDSVVLGALGLGGGEPSPPLEPEGFSLQRPPSGSTVWVIAADDAGLMYGTLELAEQIRLFGWAGIRETLQNPYMATRGTKFNIPLDARTPSYSDMSDVAQHNIATMWEMDFWRQYIDNLALHRYNLVSLWNLHPFPSMVRVPEYPDIALDDVKRSTAEFAENYSTRVVDLGGPEILGSLETIREMDIDEKIEFWREVMRYAHDRNIDFYIMTWNIYTYGTYGKYGITDSFQNDVTVDYFRRSVRAMFDTYPLLAGIGVTTGENFGQNASAASFEQKEDWVFRTYGQGLLDAATSDPSRRFVFVHRLHETGVQSDAARYAADPNVAAVDITNWFEPLLSNDRIRFLFSFKYAQAHVYSSTRQTFHDEYVRDIAGMKTLWTLRNDDVYYFRWGAPDFVREFYRNMPRADVSQGVYYGSDQYVWGRDFLSKGTAKPPPLEVDRHWYQWMLWGRMAFDPEMSNERLAAILGDRFPSVDATTLLAAWQAASMVYPVTTGFHWGLYDYHWYIEGSKGRAGAGGTPSGFHDVNRFITLGTHPGTGYLSIPEFVDQSMRKASFTGITPIEVSERLLRHSGEALALVAVLSRELESGRDAPSNPELRATLDDIVTVAHLGLYYGYKIRGATELALFRATDDPTHQAEAISQLRRAALNWRSFTAHAASRYRNPLWTNRVGTVDWRRTMTEVLGDIAIAGGEPVVPSLEPHLSGTLLEAEEAEHPVGVRSLAAAGATGSGAVHFGSDSRDAWLEWSYEATSSGNHLVEVRYATRDGIYPSAIVVPGGTSEPIVLWTTGSETTWAWDRVQVTLQPGVNRIRLEVGGPVVVDHLRIEPVH